MIAAVSDELQRRDARFATVFLHDIPNTVRLKLRLPLGDSELESRQGFRVPFDELISVYQRVGFSNFQVDSDYSDDEVRFVNEECQAALLGAFNNLDCLVVNRPVAGGSNASKPHQIDLIQEYGFSVPRTLVTTLPGAARDFFEQEDGQVIYKSVSYHRSVVKKMNEDDIERLDTIKQCPVQLQEMVDGVDYRVHVVAPSGIFACRIASAESDYRYDPETAVVALDRLPKDIEKQCLDVTRGLGLSVAGIDLRVTPEGEFFCFEVNPSPAFTWYQQRTGHPIAEAVCDLLMRGGPRV